METIPKKVAVIPGSTRPQRISRQVADWLVSTPALTRSVTLEIVDLAEWNLPLLDEPGVPALGNYAHEHTKAWSRAIGGYEGFVFVTPQYNWGYPAALKNALDYLYAEWNGKTAAIVSYGFHGGGKAAAQLRQVLEGLRMTPVATMPEITLTRAMYGEDGLLKDVAADFAPNAPTMQAALDELTSRLFQSASESPRFV